MCGVQILVFCSPYNFLQRNCGSVRFRCVRGVIEILLTSRKTIYNNFVVQCRVMIALHSEKNSCFCFDQIMTQLIEYLVLFSLLGILLKRQS